jgi:hypothetical protein
VLPSGSGTVELAVELAPMRVNVILAGFETDVPRAIAPADVGALAVHVMTSTAITGATYVTDGGHHLRHGGRD